MISFDREDEKLILTYSPENPEDVEQIIKKLTTGYWLKKTFKFTPKDLHNYHPKNSDYSSELQFAPEYLYNYHPENSGYCSKLQFKIGKIEELTFRNDYNETASDEYFKINAELLEIDFDLFFHSSISLERKHFIKEFVSIFGCFKELKPETIIIGGTHPESMPYPEFLKLLKILPSSYEIRKYKIARISSVLKNYFNLQVDGEEKYINLMNKKMPDTPSKDLEELKEVETIKYQRILEKLQTMLNDEKNYSEYLWQKEILKIITLINPKYIHVFDGVKINDTYTGKKRELDYLLIDSSGHIDLIEIKKPFDSCIITKNKYRDNHIPLRELSGTVMQVEKYIFLLNKWGKTGEDALTKKYNKSLPKNFELKITNPNGIIIMGRSENLTAAQKKDFEVIKRKYKNVIDIITYDDLISRVEFTLEQLKKN